MSTLKNARDRIFGSKPSSISDLYVDFLSYLACVFFPSLPRFTVKITLTYRYQQERDSYEYVVVDGKIVHKQSGAFLDTKRGPEGTKWIFVMSTSKRLYAGEVRIVIRFPELQFCFDSVPS